MKETQVNSLIQKTISAFVLLTAMLAYAGVTAAQSATPIPVPSVPTAAAPAPTADYRLGAGDGIHITVFQNPDLTVDTRVAESGTVTYPLIGSVRLGGLTIPQAEEVIANRLREGGFVKKPQVTIFVQVRSNQVSVLGMVNKPGRYPIETTNMRASEILAQAGGPLTVPGGNALASADVAIISGIRDGRPFPTPLKTSHHDDGGGADI